MELHGDQIDLRCLFDSLASNWRQSIESGGNKLQLLPPPAVEINCDEQKLRRVIDNLLSNAAKFTKNGRVTFSASIESGVVAISVADTGVGIADDEIGKLFETFGNAGDETDSNYGDDVRLGLPLAYRYCRLMGAELSVRSEPGAGSTFTVQLPPAAVVAPMPERKAA
jgi:signal transduction histidine kinase